MTAVAYRLVDWMNSLILQLKGYRNHIPVPAAKCRFLGSGWAVPNWQLCVTGSALWERINCWTIYILACSIWIQIYLLYMHMVLNDITWMLCMHSRPYIDTYIDSISYIIYIYKQVPNEHSLVTLIGKGNTNLALWGCDTSITYVFLHRGWPVTY